MKEGGNSQIKIFLIPELALLDILYFVLIPEVILMTSFETKIFCIIFLTDTEYNQMN